ncbi:MULTISPECIES: ROK family transcriptional regulator [Aeromicrobium]|uniref:ROK family transcriptional regulator n=1 Tax=Aeromicrobium TaxID=2040 RepID=UPI00257D8DE1|nr:MULTISPECIES: ROK family transcriptional regulator [Aeromicrobium]
MSGFGEALALFRRHGPLTRAQVVELSGLSRATATHRLDGLVRAGLIRPRADDRSTGGRPAGVFDLAAARGSLLVADIGSSHARYGLADLSGRVLEALDEDIAIDDGPDVVLGGVARAFDRLVTGSTPPVLGAAIGVPGPVDQRTGRLVSPPTMSGWDGVDVADRMAAHVGAPTVVDKDANLVALGVHRALRADAVPGADDLLVVKVGMGIGAGIISRGLVLHGARGGAGDLGHIPHDDGPRCRCGQQGCAEASAGAWAIAARLRELGHPVRTSADVVALAENGDRDATAALRAAGRRIGDVVVEAVGVLNPAMVVVGGDLAEAGDLLVDGVRERVFERSHPLATTDLTVVASPLGADAGLLGAAQMAADAALAPARVDTLVGA